MPVAGVLANAYGVTMSFDHVRLQLTLLVTSIIVNAQPHRPVVPCDDDDLGFPCHL